MRRKAVRLAPTRTAKSTDADNEVRTRWQTKLKATRLSADKRTQIGTVALSPCVWLVGKILMPGWSPKDGRLPIVNFRQTTSPKSVTPRIQKLVSGKASL